MQPKTPEKIQRTQRKSPLMQPCTSRKKQATKSPISSRPINFGSPKRIPRFVYTEQRGQQNANKRGCTERHGTQRHRAAAPPCKQQGGNRLKSLRSLQQAAHCGEYNGAEEVHYANGPK